MWGKHTELHLVPGKVRTTIYYGQSRYQIDSFAAYDIILTTYNTVAGEWKTTQARGAKKSNATASDSLASRNSWWSTYHREQEHSDIKSSVSTKRWSKMVHHGYTNSEPVIRLVHFAAVSDTLSLRQSSKFRKTLRGAMEEFLCFRGRAQSAITV